MKKRKILLLIFVLLFLFSKTYCSDCKKEKCMKGFYEISNGLVVVLDPGHCSKNLRPGAVNNNFIFPPVINSPIEIYEAYFTHELGEEIQDILKNKYRIDNVYITYKKDPKILTAKNQTIELDLRAAAIKQLLGNLNGLEKDKCLFDPEGIFLSLHLNSFHSASAHGSEQLFYYILPRTDSKKINFLPIYNMANISDLGLFRNRGIKLRQDVKVLKAVHDFSFDENNNPKNDFIVQHALGETCFISNNSDMQKYLLYYEEIRDAYINAIISYYVKRIDKYIDKCIVPIFVKPDNPDDNYSYAVANYKDKDIPYISTKAKIVMPIEFINRNVIKLMPLMKEPLYFTFLNLKPQMAKKNPVLIIPSGKLGSLQNNLKLKQTLKQYVSQGGTIIVFSQQYGSHIENIVPVPKGEKLKVYGWRQDQSCYWGSVYTDLTHPVLSSLISDKATLAVDGYVISIEP